ncbi:hypothetical protein QQA05_10435, partial [Corynebacterium macclintockiae]|uniref:hypothetical protein n=1 Tax=Corynebacterium macclintockiae TaxID=2913501 RepID=UPI00254E9D9B
YADGAAGGCVVAGVVAPVEDVGEHAAGADLGGDAAVVSVAVVIRSTIPAGWLGSSVSGQKLLC